QPDQGSDPADARGSGRQHRHLPDQLGTAVRRDQGSRRPGPPGHAAARSARLRRPRDAAARSGRATELVRQVREERRRTHDARRVALMNGFELPTAIDISSVVGLIAVGIFTAQILLGLLVSVGYNPIRRWPRIRGVKLFTFHNWLAYIGLGVAFVHPAI